MISPVMPEMVEPNNTAIFELSIKCESLKAKIEMNIDIVKPMPAKIPIENRCFNFKSAGSKHQPSVMPIHENKKMPSGLPMISPSITPKLFIENKS